MTQAQKNKAAAMAATAGGITTFAAESYVYLIAKLKQKNGLNFKLMDAVDIDWTGFDWTGIDLPTYTPTPASATAAGVVKIGDNISVTADGTISVSKDNVNAALGYTAANAADVTTLQGYFDDAGNAKNADQLDGHTTDYFATAESVTALQNGMRWQSPVADVAALKAVAAPKDTEARITEDTNTIYIFDAENKATADAADGSVIVATDKTAGAWVKQGTAIYSPATSTVDGLWQHQTKPHLIKLSGISARFRDISPAAKQRPL